MRVKTQRKKLARTTLLFSASSLCAILVCLAATHHGKASTPRTAILPVYTYQNPFALANNASPAVLPGTKTVGVLTNLVSVKCLLGLWCLGALWLVSTWHLQGGQKTNKRAHRQVSCSTSAQMKPLAILPVVRVQKQDTFCPPVFCHPTVTRSPAHRKTTAPCQSRFRPIVLAGRHTRLGAGQARLGRME